MRFIFVLVIIAAVALAKKPHRELTEEERSKYDEIRQAKLEKLSPEAQTAGKKVHEIFQSKKDDRKAAHEEVHAFIQTLPESVRVELKSIRAEFQARLQEKIDKLSDEGKTAAKQIHVIRQANKGDRKAVKEAIDKVLDSLSESVREELKILRPKHTRGDRS